MRGGIRQRREEKREGCLAVREYEAAAPPISETDSSMHFGIISQEGAQTIKLIVTLSSIYVQCRCHG